MRLRQDKLRFNIATLGLFYRSKKPKYYINCGIITAIDMMALRGKNS
jgi:hypothetical protein